MNNKTVSVFTDLAVVFFMLGVLGLCLSFFLWAWFGVAGYFS